MAASYQSYVSALFAVDVTSADCTTEIETNWSDCTATHIIERPRCPGRRMRPVRIEPIIAVSPPKLRDPLPRPPLVIAMPPARRLGVPCQLPHAKFSGR